MMAPPAFDLADVGGGVVVSVSAIGASDGRDFVVWTEREYWPPAFGVRQRRGQLRVHLYTTRRAMV
jgi:hypothetical protein